MPDRTVSVIAIRDDTFEVYLSARQIARRVSALGRQIARDFPDNPLFVGVLTGGFMFMADLVRAYDRPCQLAFVKISSYGDAQTSSGAVTTQLDLSTDITGRHVVIVEDIVDTGLSITYLAQHLAARRPASLSVATLLRKADATTQPVQLHYVGFTIPNLFVVGYGLDYAGVGRNLPDLYVRSDSRRRIK